MTLGTSLALGGKLNTNRTRLGSQRGHFKRLSNLVNGKLRPVDPNVPGQDVTMLLGTDVIAYLAHLLKFGVQKRRKP
jgi:hypothetical protein